MELIAAINELCVEMNWECNDTSTFYDFIEVQIQNHII